MINNMNVKTNQPEFFKFKATTPASQLSHLCMQYINDNRWIVLFDPTESMLKQLAHLPSVLANKILRVKTDNKTINIDKLLKTLNKGTCSAVFLSENWQQLLAKQCFRRENSGKLYIH